MTKKQADKSEEVKPDEPKCECYMDGTPAAVGDLCLFQDHYQGVKVMREGVLVHIAKGAGEMDGIVAYTTAEFSSTEMDSVVLIKNCTKHVTISKCQKSGLESEF